MAVSEEDVRKIAKLARINLSDEEIQKFAPQMSTIVKYMDILNGVNTQGVEVLASVNGEYDVTRPDTVQSWVSRDELLAQSPLPIQNDQIKVPSIFDES